MEWKYMNALLHFHYNFLSKLKYTINIYTKIVSIWSRINMFKLVKLYNIKPEHKCYKCLNVPNYRYNSAEVQIYVPEIFLKYGYKLLNLYDAQFLLDELTLFRKKYNIKDKLQIQFHDHTFITDSCAGTQIFIHPKTRRSVIIKIKISLRIDTTFYYFDIKSGGIRKFYIQDLINLTGDDRLINAYNTRIPESIPESMPESMPETNINKVLDKEILSILYQN